MLSNESIQTKTYREKFFSDLCHLSWEIFVFFLLFILTWFLKNIMFFFIYCLRLDTNMELTQLKIEQNLIRYTGELRDITILE